MRRFALGMLVESVIKKLSADEHVVVVVTKRGPDCGCQDCKARWTETGKPRLRVLAAIEDEGIPPTADGGSDAG